MKKIIARLLILSQIFSSLAFADVQVAPVIIGATIVGGTSTASSTGNSATATALAADPADCAVGSYSRGITASGSAVGCAIAVGSGTVTSVSGVATNGFSFSIATSETTPTITLSITASGVLKSNGTSVTSAVPNVDYITPSGGSSITGMAISQVQMTGGFSTVEAYLTDIGSAGWIEGGTINDAGGGNITVDSGEVSIRTGATSTSPLQYRSFSALGSTAIPLDTTRYIVVNYNAGTPIIQASATDTSNGYTIIYLGEVHNTAGTLSIHNDHRPVGDAINRLENAWTSLIGTKVVSGEIVSDPTPTSRKIAITAGSIIDRFLRSLTTAAFDSSVADVFTTVRRDGAGGWIYVAAQSDVDNTSYDANSSVIGTMTGGYYANRWVIRGINGDVAVQYGQAEYATQASAVAETEPLTRPEQYTEHGYYVAQLTYLKSAAGPAVITAIKPTLGGTTNITGTSVHNDLSGLQGGTASQYYHLTSTEYTGTGSASFVRATSPTIATPTLTTPAVNGYTEGVCTPTVTAGAVTLDVTTCTFQKVVTAANTTITLPSAAAGKSYTVQVCYGGAHTITWAGGGTLSWSAATAPTATSTNAKCDLYIFTSHGATYTFGQDGGRNFAGS